jgi:hypothetical protein
MATAYLTYEKVEFIIKEHVTICNIFYSSNEPGTPWGGGWKHKEFPKDKSVIDILNNEIADFIKWEDGKLKV